MLLHFNQNLNCYINMATSLNAIADLLVPEDQRKKPENQYNEDDDDDFNKQLELAIKLSLNESEPDPKKTHAISINGTASPSNKAKSKRFKKMAESIPEKNKSNRERHEGGRMFSTNNLTELSYEEQVELAEARSKFDVDIPPPSNVQTICEEDLIKIAIQKSKDPSEQIDEENRLLLKAIEASKLESEAFFDSDDTSSNSTSTSTNSDFRAFYDVRSLSDLADEQRRNVEGLAARKRGGGGTNRPLTDHTSLFNNRSDPESEEDDQIKFAKQLSLGQTPYNTYVGQTPYNTYVGQTPYSTCVGQTPFNTYVATAARKLTNRVQASKSQPGIAIRNVYANPSNVMSVAVANAYRAGPGTRRRPIIVDGCNVAFQHGKNDRYSAKGLLLVYQYFVDRFRYTNSEITIINKYSKHMPDEDREIVEGLYKIDVLITSPSRMVGGRLICSDDDLFVLNMAKEKNGIVVSLDQFRDAYSRTKDKEIRDVIKYRILQFAFKGDEVIFPNDPLGPNGPNLSEFLKY